MCVLWSSQTNCSLDIGSLLYLPQSHFLVPTATMLNNEEALIPCTVIPNVFLQQSVYIGQFVLP